MDLLTLQEMVTAKAAPSPMPAFAAVAVFEDPGAGVDSFNGPPRQIFKVPARSLRATTRCNTTVWTAEKQLDATQ